MNNANENSIQTPDAQPESGNPLDVPVDPVRGQEGTAMNGGGGHNAHTVVPEKGVPSTNVHGASSSGKKSTKKSGLGDEDKGVEMKLEPNTFSVFKNRPDSVYTGSYFDESLERTRDGEKMTPLDVFEDVDNGERHAPDGWLRVLICMALEIPVPVIVFKVKNAKRRAQQEALKANSNGVRPRTNQEKRDKVNEALDDEEWGKLPPKEVAILTGTSRTFVANVMRERAAKAKVEAESEKTPPVDNDSPADTKVDVVVPADAESVDDADEIIDAASEELQRTLEELNRLEEDKEWVAAVADKKALEKIAKSVKILTKRCSSPVEFDIARLKGLMQRFNLSNDELARLLGTSHASVSRWLNGKSHISQRHAKAAEEALCLSGEEILAIVRGDCNE